MTAPMVESGPLRTGQVAAAAGVNVQTLRYYERRGLLADPVRSLGGHRLYPPETVDRIQVIKSAQRLGFTLAEVSELLDAAQHRHGRRRSGGGLNDRATAKLAEVEQRIADLQVIRATLQAVLASECDSLTNCTCDPALLRPLDRLAGGSHRL